MISSSLYNLKLILCWLSAILLKISMICLSSVESVFKKFLRAGVLKNKFLTEINVPFENEPFSLIIVVPSSILIKVPNSSSLVSVLISSWLTDAIELKASPLKPRVEIESRIFHQAYFTGRMFLNA